jgi:serine protease
MNSNRVFVIKSFLFWMLLVCSSVVRAQTTPLSDIDSLRYIASHPDLIAAFGADPAKGRSHYEAWGIKEGRKITFEPLNYTASNPDLIGAFGIDETKAATHYIQWGFKEKRQTTFKPLNYIASHPDLISAFGADAAKGARHFIQSGFAEKRQVTFDPFRYMASHPDLIQAFSGDETKAATHYIQAGFRERRQTTFSDVDALQYVASFADLITSIGSNVQAAIFHYVTTGYNAGRRIFFDALSYIASFGDLIAAFGTNSMLGVQHYINWGYAEGRRVVFDALGYLAKHSDLRAAFGTDLAAATRHYINWGFSEKRTYDFSVSGNVRVVGVLQIDSDTNDKNAQQSANNTISTAQVLVAPFTLVGHVNRINAGNKDGRWYSAGDLDDVYRITLRKGQAAVLQVAAEKQSEGDVRLELYDSQGTLVAGIKPYGRQHSVAAPVDGEYFVAVRVASGASRYTLEIESFVPGASASSVAFHNDDDFVSGDLLVAFRTSKSISIAETESISGSPSSAGATGDFSYRINDDLGKNLYEIKLNLGSVERALGGEGETGAILGRFRDEEQELKYLTAMASREFSRDPAVTAVYLNYRSYPSAVPNDPEYARQRWHYEQINLPSAWDLTKGSSEVVVAVLDTGVIRHPDLVDNLLAGFDFVSSDPLGDGDGEDADPSDPGKFEENSNTPRRSHGTHVAGTVAARGNNGTGGSGSSWNTKILPVRVLSSKGDGTSADIIKGMRYAAGLLTSKPPKVANIINLSLGSSRRCSEFQAVINEVRAVGIIVVAANGNSKGEGTDFVGTPANCDGVVSVAATDPKGGTTYYSQEGPETDIAAPGGAGNGRSVDDVYSTDMYRIGNGSTVGSYQAINGTSMATPHVAGVISLMKAAKPSLTPDEFDQLLAAGRLTRDIERCDSTTFIDGTVVRSNCQQGKDVASGYGLIDAYKAVEAVLGSTPAIPPRIDVSPGRIDFGNSVASAEVYVTLVGESALPVTVTPSTSSQSWLRLSGPTQIDRRTLRYTVLADRGLVANGVFEGLVTFRAATSSASLNTLNVPVYMSKPATAVLGNAGLQYALLIDPKTFKTVASTAFFARQSGAAFSIVGVPKGTYYVVSGTDTDNNNFICEEGEICSIYAVLKGESDSISVNGPVARLILEPRIIGGAAVQAASSESSDVVSNDSWIGIPRTGSVSPEIVRRLLSQDGVSPSRGGSEIPILRSGSTQ